MKILPHLFLHTFRPAFCVLFVWADSHNASFYILLNISPLYTLFNIYFLFYQSMLEWIRSSIHKIDDRIRCKSRLSKWARDLLIVPTKKKTWLPPHSSLFWLHACHPAYPIHWYLHKQTCIQTRKRERMLDTSNGRRVSKILLKNPMIALITIKGTL